MLSKLNVLTRVLCLTSCLSTTAAAQDLVTAAQTGDLAALQVILSPGSQPDPETLVRPLYFAAQRGHEAAVKYLLEQGAPADASTDLGTALAHASRGNHTGIVTALLAAGANPNLPGGEEGRVPLHHAAERGAMEAARLLLKHGANVNARSVRFGWPAIHFAAYKGRTEMVALLREMGAAPEAVDPLQPGELDAVDLEKGRILAFQCAGCHGMEQGEIGHGQHPGPFLAGIVGRAKASIEDFLSQIRQDNNPASTHDEASSEAA